MVSFGTGGDGDDVEVEGREVNSVAADFEAQFHAIVAAEGDGALLIVDAAAARLCRRLPCVQGNNRRVLSQTH